MYALRASTANEFCALVRKQLHVGDAGEGGSPAEATPDLQVFKVAGEEHSATCCVFVGITNNSELERRISPTKVAHQMLKAVARNQHGLAGEVLKSCEAVVRVIPCEWAVPVDTLVQMFDECAAGEIEAGAMHQFLTVAGHFPEVGKHPKDNTYNIVFEEHSSVASVDPGAITAAAERAVTSKKYVRVPHEGTKGGARAPKTFVICLAGDIALLSVVTDWFELHRYSLHQVASHTAAGTSPSKGHRATAVPVGESTASSVNSIDPNRG